MEPLRPGCTALVAAGRCGDNVTRVFCSAFYPEGPEMRLCRVHARRYYSAAIDVCRGKTPETFLASLADDWRFAP